MILFIEVIYNIFYLFLEDRFKYKKILITLFILIAITNFCEFVYYILQYYNKESDIILKFFNLTIKWIQLFHSFILLFLGFMAFVKMKIKTTIFY